MSLSSEYHANMRLTQVKPDATTVKQWIKSLEENSEYILKHYLTGMDGHARSLHKNSTQIRVYREYLAKIEI